MKRILKILVYFISILVIVYLVGPRPDKPVYDLKMPEVPAQSQELEQYVRSNEAKHHLKKDNEARIIWYNDSLKNKTEYAIVYLHGFSASQAEGDPVHIQTAKRFGCNLYLSRLADHGIDTVDALIYLTADKYWASVKRALAIGKQLGEKVILMGTSTGGTNALQLAAAFPRDVYALILLSPNIAINNDKAYLLNNPWGLQLARLIKGSDYMDAKDSRDIYKQYWYAHYRLEGTVALQEMLETTMNEKTFRKVTRPTLMLYYYKDKIHQDSVVRVEAMKQMFEELGTPPGEKRSVVIPGAGDHVLGSYIKSHDVEGVQKEVEKFMKEVLGMTERGS